MNEYNVFRIHMYIYNSSWVLWAASIYYYSTTLDGCGIGLGFRVLVTSM